MSSYLRDPQWRTKPEQTRKKSNEREKAQPHVKPRGRVGPLLVGERERELDRGRLQDAQRQGKRQNAAADCRSRVATANFEMVLDLGSL